MRSFHGPVSDDRGTGFNRAPILCASYGTFCFSFLNVPASARHFICFHSILLAIKTENTSADESFSCSEYAVSQNRLPEKSKERYAIIVVHDRFVGLYICTTIVSVVQIQVVTKNSQLVWLVLGRPNVPLSSRVLQTFRFTRMSR